MTDAMKPIQAITFTLILRGKKDSLVDGALFARRCYIERNGAEPTVYMIPASEVSPESVARLTDAITDARGSSFDDPIDIVPSPWNAAEGAVYAGRG